MASSSASFNKRSYQYDVFLSFSGEDTRKNFIDHLYDALQRHGIHTFKDDERLKKGKSIGDQLLKSIEESKLFIIVFSKKYASSSWCLNELVKIMECQKSNEQIAYPVFYDVDPSEVRKQNGLVGEALAKQTNKETGKWRQALTEASNLSGWDLKNTLDGHEANVIKLIVEQISLELRSIDVKLDDNLEGMEPRLRDLQSSIDIGSNDVRMIGIKGMGGAGKTTLAQATFDRISSHFEAKCFVENVREVSKASLSGLLSLQKKILKDLLNVQENNVNSFHEGTNMMKTKLCGRKVLVVLDDVDHKDQLEALAGDINWFKPGSRIIITTRDEQVLIAHRVKWIHNVNLLSDKEAIGLFSRYAFGKDIPKEYEKQSQQVIHYAAGLPLTIKVLGSSLCGRDMAEWNDALKRLETIPLKETLKKLELSYESLEDDYKEIFLDISCLLRGWKKEDVIDFLESCGFCSRIGLKVLEQRSLITFKVAKYPGGSFTLDMHDHIEEMGKNIVRRFHPDEPNKHSRMWIKEEIEDVLYNDLGTEATRCMKLEFSEQTVLKSLGKMKKLRCLIIDNIDCEYVDFKCFPNSLRYLSWSISGRRLPSSPKAELPTPSFPDWTLPSLPKAEGKVMKELEFIRLFYLEKLITLDLRLIPNLVKLELQKCRNLETIHVPDRGLKSLVHLDLTECKSLESFSFIKELKSLEVLSLVDINNSSLNRTESLVSFIGNIHNLLFLSFTSRNIKSLPERFCSLQHLKVLKLWAPITELPRDIGRLEYLEVLVLKCMEIKHLPDSICKLKHLKFLAISFTNELTQLPEDFGQIESLISLNVSYTDIREFPSSICMLKHLKKLVVERKLETLPENLGDLECLEELHLHETNIREIPSSICMLKHLKMLYVTRCLKLEKLPENLGDLECLEVLVLSGTPICRLPYSISLLKGLEIVGYEKRMDSEALLSQEQPDSTTLASQMKSTDTEAITCDVTTNERRNTDTEAITCDVTTNESQPSDLNEHSTHAPERRSTYIEATTSCDDATNESQPLDLNEQQITHAVERRSTAIEATTCDAIMNVSQQLDLSEQTVDQASNTRHIRAKRSNRFRKILHKWKDFLSCSTSAGDKVEE